MIKTRNDLWQIVNLEYPTVELGVAEGLFSRDILSWGSPKHYLIDCWETIPNATGDVTSEQDWHDRNYKNAQILAHPYGDKAVFLKGLSSAMVNHIPDNSVGLVYIDGGHAYHVVKQDIELYMPKLIKGGIMAFHDFLAMEYGVNRAVKEYCAKNKIEWTLIPDISNAHAGAYFYKP